MKNHNVSGEVFLKLTEEEMKEIFPLLGDRKKVLLLRSSCFTVHTDEGMAAASCSATPRMKSENLVCIDNYALSLCACSVHVVFCVIYPAVLSDTALHGLLYVACRQLLLLLYVNEPHSSSPQTQVRVVRYYSTNWPTSRPTNHGRLLYVPN